jgi:hypothetical protein
MLPVDCGNPEGADRVHKKPVTRPRGRSPRGGRTSRRRSPRQLSLDTSDTERRDRRDRKAKEDSHIPKIPVAQSFMSGSEGLPALGSGHMVIYRNRKRRYLRDRNGLRGLRASSRKIKV